MAVSQGRVAWLHAACVLLPAVIAVASARLQVAMRTNMGYFVYWLMIECVVPIVTAVGGRVAEKMDSAIAMDVKTEAYTRLMRLSERTRASIDVQPCRPLTPISATCVSCIVALLGGV